MTREEIIEQYPIALAEKEGKKIQYYCDGKWIDCVGSAIYGQGKLRVKPEQTKRLPIIQEVQKWFLEDKVFKFKTKHLNHVCLQRIISFDSLCDKPILIGNGQYYSIEMFCDLYTQLDGSELYITE